METYLNFHTQLLLALVAILSIVTAAVKSVKRFFIRRRFAREHGCKPITKSFSKDPFLGLDTLPATFRALAQHRFLQRSCEVFRDLGNTFTGNELNKRIIVTIEPENIKTILSLKFNDYGISHRLKPFKPLLGEGIFDTDGDHWAASRALIRPSFTRDQVADLDSFEDLFQDLIALLPRDGKTMVDLQDLFFRYTIDSATEFLFGRSVGTLKKAHAEPEFAQAFHYAQKAIITRAMLGPLEMFWHDRKANEANRMCRDFAKKLVDEAYREIELGKEAHEPEQSDLKAQKHIFSHDMASRTSDKHRVLDELMNLLLAGRDTTASLLSNMFFVLARSSTIWAKLRQEVSHLQGRTPTYEELNNLKYVQCCLNESLRLYPSVPRNDREAIRDTVLPLGGGEDGLAPLLVTKGTIVGYNIYVMHRRMDIYGTDAEEFRPERWEDGKLMPRWGYLPFNGGPRICIGQRYALTEVGYVLVRMAQEFQAIESADSGPWEESLTLTLCSRNGVKVRLIPA